MLLYMLFYCISSLYCYAVVFVACQLSDPVWVMFQGGPECKYDKSFRKEKDSRYVYVTFLGKL